MKLVAFILIAALAGCGNMLGKIGERADPPTKDKQTKVPQ